MTYTKSGTHLPYLLEAARRTTGPILELGMGVNSTLQLRHFRGRGLYSFDNNAEWASQYFQYRDSLHRIAVVSDWSTVPYEMLPWGLVLVDQSPGAERGKCLERLRFVADVLVCHDSEDPCYGYEEAFKGYRYVRTYKDLDPWTSIVSNYVDVSAWEIAA